MTLDAVRPAPNTDRALGLVPSPPVPAPVPGWIEPDGARDGYRELLGSVNRFLDLLATARLDEAGNRTLFADLDTLSEQLADHSVSEDDQVFARRSDLPSRGQTLCPTYVVREATADTARATIIFGRYHLGRNGAVHGGSLALVFEDFMGQLAILGGRTFARAAYTHVDDRSVTPVGVELELRGGFVSEEGRKRVLRAELRDGDRVCAEAEELVIELRPGQP